MNYSRYLNAGEQTELGRQYAEAEKDYRQAASEAQRFGPKSVEVKESGVRLATVLVLQNKLGAAEPAYQKAVEDLKGADPGNPERLVWMDDLADAYILQASTSEWEFCLKHALQLLKLATPDQRKVAYTQQHLAQLLMHGKRFSEAIALLKEAVPSLEKKRGITSNDAINARMVLCEAFLEAGDFKNCEIFGKHALDAAGPPKDSVKFFIAATHRFLARAYLKDKKYTEAERELLETLKIHEGDRHPQGVNDFVADYALMCSIYLSQENAEKAQMYGQKAFLLCMKPECGVCAADRIEFMKTAASACRANHNQRQAAEIDKERQKLERAAK